MFSTIGMRIQNEQSGSSSLFAQPLVIEPVLEKAEIAPPEQEAAEIPTPQPTSTDNSPEEPSSKPAAPQKLARGALEARLEEELAGLVTSSTPSATVRQAHLALLKRWYYRPEARRTGEIFFPGADGRWPAKAILRGAGRIAAKMLTSSSE